MYTCAPVLPFLFCFVFHVARSPRRFGFPALKFVFLLHCYGTVRRAVPCTLALVAVTITGIGLRDSRAGGCPGSVRLLYVTCCYAMSPAASFFVPCATFEQVWSVAYSPAGDKLVSGCDDGVLQVFERA